MAHADPKEGGVLYVSSARNRGFVDCSLKEFHDRRGYGHAMWLYCLSRRGWRVHRAGREWSSNPARLGRHMASTNPSLVVAYGATSWSPIVARRCFSPWNGPVVHDWEDYYADIWRANFGLLGGALMAWIEKRTIMKSDYVVTLSHYNLHRAKSWGRKVWYIPNGCNLPEFDDASCQIRLDGEMNIVYIGDVGRYKRTHELIEAMASVPKRIKLYFAGNRLEYLERMAPENVVFLGRVSRNDLWSILHQADVVACTADQDCAAKYEDYLRAKKPILAYDGRANYRFTNRRNALLTKDYASAIMELYRSPELRNTLAMNAAADIPVHTWEEIAAQYDSAFREMIDDYTSTGGATRLP